MYTYWPKGACNELAMLPHTTPSIFSIYIPKHDMTVEQGDCEYARSISQTPKFNNIDIAIVYHI